MPPQHAVVDGAAAAPPHHHPTPSPPQRRHGRRRRRRQATLASLLPIALLGLSSLLVLGGLLHLPTSLAAREGDFKKCADSSFCRRLRRLSSYVEQLPPKTRPHFKSPYSLPSRATPPSYDASTSTLTTPVVSALHPNVSFQLTLRFLADGAARFTMDEVGQRHGGWKRFDEAARWAIHNHPGPADAAEVHVEHRDGSTLVQYGPQGAYQLELLHDPLKATFSRDGVPQVVLNERGLLHMEHFRPKPNPFPTPDAAAAVEGAQQDGNDATPPPLVLQNRKRSLVESGFASSDALAEAWAGFEKEDAGEWEENWKGKPDSKPKGPEAVSLDVSFPGKRFAFGLPEHASPLNLRSTRGEREGDYKDPYRLMNTDVFEYLHDSPMSLYGSVPLLHAQSRDGAASVFWLSGSETWIDIDRNGPGGSDGGSDGSDDGEGGRGAESGSLQTHWISESGVLDVFVYLAPTTSSNLQTYTRMVGRTALPQYFAIGYHQCRWNYLSTDDVLTVNARFNEADIPMDVMWLDIEYALEHMYGVWNEQTFPKPERMLEGLDADGRKLVIILDPHLKRTRDYYLYAEAQDRGLFVRTPDGKGEYEGWCWSGSASWIDFFHPKSWGWWSGQFELAKKRLKANARNLHIWNDMNEPAIFDGPEVTSPKDVRHHGGWEHRDLHNINAVTMQNATQRGLIERETPHRRPFVLARGWWVGTQRYGAVWTGDNMGTWEHLAVSVPMILANNIVGMSFCGADVGGFFTKEPEPDFLLRWFQAGIFEPFFRNHAHIDTKRREPFLLEEPWRSHVRELIKLRYCLLPAWYTAFKEDNAAGSPVLRPQFLMFPNDTDGMAIDDQYYVGDSGLLVKPAVEKDVDSVEVYLAEDKPYYNFFSHEVYRGSANPGRRVRVPAPLTEQMPLLHRGGSILPLRQRTRRSAELGARDPFTLVVALDQVRDADDVDVGGRDEEVRAEGLLYLDDGQTFGFERGEFAWRRFRLLRQRAAQHEGQGSAYRHRLVSLDEAARRDGSGAKSDVARKQRGSDNAFVRSLEGVRVERVVVLGLESAPRSVRLVRHGDGDGDGDREVDGEELEFSWTPGTSASGGGGGAGAKLASVVGGLQAKLSGGSTSGAEGVASKLVIRDPAVRVAEGGWSIVLSSEPDAETRRGGEGGAKTEL